MNILQEIFKDNYEVIQYSLHPRAVEMENIEKMIGCGVKYCQERSTSMYFKLLQCHHHCIFTIDEELRHFFLEDRSLFHKAPHPAYPEWNFKMTPYYGLYARHRTNDPTPGCRAVHPSKHAIFTI